MANRGFSSSDSLSGIYVLVVDHDRERRTLVIGILRYCGALVAPADSPQAALDSMALLKPDVVIADVSEPDAGGLALIRGLRALKPDDGGMVAAIAVGDGDRHAELARARGYDAYLTTPLEPWDLSRAIVSLLSR